MGVVSLKEARIAQIKSDRTANARFKEARIDEILADRKLTAHQRVIGVLIYRRINPDHDLPHAWPSRESIKRDTGFDIVTVRYAIDRLMQLGYLDIVYSRSLRRDVFCAVGEDRLPLWGSVNCSQGGVNPRSDPVNAGRVPCEYTAAHIEEEPKENSKNEPGARAPCPSSKNDSGDNPAETLRRLSTAVNDAGLTDVARILTERLARSKLSRADGLTTLMVWPQTHADADVLREHKECQDGSRPSIDRIGYQRGILNKFRIMGF